jgi:hypothetical protein
VRKSEFLNQRIIHTSFKDSADNFFSKPLASHFFAYEGPPKGHFLVAGIWKIESRIGNYSTILTVANKMQ